MSHDRSCACLTVEMSLSMKYRYDLSGTLLLELRTLLYAPSISCCSSSVACLMCAPCCTYKQCVRAFQIAKGYILEYVLQRRNVEPGLNTCWGINSSSVWNSAIRFCTRRRSKFSPVMRFCCFEGVSRPLHKHFGCQHLIAM